jgi:hypothetical protein
MVTHKGLQSRTELSALIRYYVGEGYRWRRIEKMLEADTKSKVLNSFDVDYCKEYYQDLING